jgi:phage tail sheath protein FI
MPIQPTYPGIYVEEIPSGVRTITGVSTSDTAFIDFFQRGPTDRAVRITSFADFDRRFGGLDRRSEASYAIRQFYLNGGRIAWVVRVAANDADTAAVSLPTADDGTGTTGELIVRAASVGAWGNDLQVGVEHVANGGTPTTFNLVVRYRPEAAGRRQIVATEAFRNLSVDPASARYVTSVVNTASELVQVEDQSNGTLPDETGDNVLGSINVVDPATAQFEALGATSATAGSDGTVPGEDGWVNTIGAAALLGEDHNGADALNDGINLLARIDPFTFSILCVPAAAGLSTASFNQVVTAAAGFCRANRAFLIVDIPEEVTTGEDMVDWRTNTITLADNQDYAAVYFPRVEIADPLNENRPRNVGASGTLAGIYARTDATRGVWKAPAGTEAGLAGARLPVTLTDDENGGLNPLGINVLRNFPIFGNIAWGARTLDGADQAASEWKYIPVRRTALFIESSLYQGLKWVVFEPNDEPLWAQIRLNVGAFMHNLFRQGAFQGRTPREAYLVKCDSETTTQNDINLGIVNILVGFAPLKPAEFVFIKIQQLAGQVQV